MNLLPFNTLLELHYSMASAFSDAHNSVKQLLALGCISECKARPILNSNAPSLASFVFDKIDAKWGNDEYGNHPGYVCDYDQRSTDDIWKELTNELKRNPESFLKALHAIAEKEDDYLEFINKGIALAKNQ